MFLEFFKFSTNQRLTLLIMCSLGFAKGFFPLRFPRKSPRPPCFWRPFGAGSYSGICRAICAKRGREFFGCKQGKGVYLLTAAGGWEFFGCRQGKGVLLPTAAGGWEFFGCGRGEGVSLPTAVGAGSFFVAGRTKVSLYLPPQRDGFFWLQEGQRCPSTYRRRSREFFCCAWGKGVSLPTTEGDGVFWLRVGRGCPPSYRRGGDGVFWLQAERGCLSAYHRGAGAEKRPPAGGMGGGGLLRAYNWSAADTIRTHLDGETNSPYPKPYNTPY